MIDALFNQPNYVATKKMLDATALRHEAIASNIANVETPGYKRIDLATSFADELKSAVASQDVNKISAITPKLLEDTSAIAATRDGNTVQLETELMHLNQNTMEHTVETQLISGNLMRLRMAITGQVS
jgi:flagellar basal-body rod protein FlgB